MRPPEYWINYLNLKPHPEGGFYRETYRAAEEIAAHGLPDRFDNARNFATAIHFLLRAEDKSRIHRIKSDELWHFHAGDTLKLYVLTPHGLITHRLGTNLEQGDQPQVTIPANHWFGAMVMEYGHYTLSSCTVAPGFDFKDFELGDRNKLNQEFPSQVEIIRRLT
ncbi:MAG: cupin domain-containing protein [Cyclobacteriaceae bacterium]|nr:cupin domain-containing protein [Cyclobacteriaceae bacterium]